MKPGILVISHGSREAEWVRLVDEAVAAVRLDESGSEWTDVGEEGEGRAVQPDRSGKVCGGEWTGPASETGTAASLDESGAACGASGFAAADAGGVDEPAGRHGTDVWSGGAAGRTEQSGTENSGRPLTVVSSFLEIVEGRLIQDGIDRLEAEGVTDVYVLPLFVSSGSTHVDDIAQAFGLPPVSAERPGDLAPLRCGGMRVHFGQPIDDDADIAELLLANIRDLSDAPEQERLLLVAHGSREAGFFARWRSGMTQLAERMRLRGGFAGADIAMLLPDQAACKLRALRRKRPEETFIVVPLFLSAGYFTNIVIPTRLEGLEYRYNGRAMLPNPYISRWMARQIAAWLEKLGRNSIQ